VIQPSVRSCRMKSRQPICFKPLFYLGFAGVPVSHRTDLRGLLQSRDFAAWYHSVSDIFWRSTMQWGDCRNLVLVKKRWHQYESLIGVLMLIMALFFKGKLTTSGSPTCANILGNTERFDMANMQFSQMCAHMKTIKRSHGCWLKVSMQLFMCKILAILGH
jgi:hypothetical protein